nr:hypothetical protein [Oscillatoriaceae cyanobacterium Prado104]
LNWHDYLVMVSCVASVAGLLLLGEPTATKSEMPADERALSEEILMKMSFTYSIVYSISALGLNFPLPEESIVLLSLKFSTVLSYLLTASSILSLPLQRITVRQIEE